MTLKILGKAGRKIVQLNFVAWMQKVLTAVQKIFSSAK